MKCPLFPEPVTFLLLLKGWDIVFPSLNDNEDDPKSRKNANFFLELFKGVSLRM